MSPQTVSAADGMLRIGDRSVPLIAGEIQFWRMHPDTWEPAVRAARQAGVTVVSTYLSWRRHEPQPGAYDFDGHGDPRLNVRGFLQICADLGTHVQLKPGPWICAEEPGGGYPDWLLEREELLARDDSGELVIGYNPPFQHPVPAYLDGDYLEAVAGWFDAVWDSVGDQVFPNGPIIAVQLDNEPSSCFQDAMYGADYSASSVAAFRAWLREQYDGDLGGFRSAWALEHVRFDDAEPPRRPSGEPEASRERLHDWIRFKTHATGAYLETLRRLHVERGGSDLLYTVNIVTHPVHDVPVAHSAIRRATGAAVGEDHYYIPPLDTDDIHRLARSAATARAAGEPAPWVPELQAGIWRSPGELVDYPEPTPLEQEIWWGAAVALGFAGANLYMLVDRENWEHSPLDIDGRHSSFFAPVGGLLSLAANRPDALALPIQPAVIVAWHRPDAYDAYTVAGTSRVPEVPWHNHSESAAYELWDRTLRELSALGAPFDLWDTATALDLPSHIPLLVPEGSGVEPALLAEIRTAGRTVLTLGEFAAGVAASVPHVVGAAAVRADRTLVSVRQADHDTIVHVVHWGEGDPSAYLVLPGMQQERLLDLATGTHLTITEGRVPLALTPGHRVFAASIG